ncbi:phosphoribosyltransferase [Candidatus Bathyarchaeota archaeon]|nr:phosphoribosyltransferase [Candidatus Bathyarchaeota archaeon]
MSFEVPGWDDIYDGCLQLADKIKKSGFKPEVIVGVARGGWIPARILSDLLCNTYVASMRVEFYKDVAETAKRPVISQQVSASVVGKRVLVVDDVADTGESLTAVRRDLLARKALEVKIATLHYKPKSILRPDFYVSETSAWIVYPHERYEFVRSRVVKLKSEGRSKDEAKEELARIGLPQGLVERFVDECWNSKGD